MDHGFKTTECIWTNETMKEDLVSLPVVWLKEGKKKMYKGGYWLVVVMVMVIVVVTTVLVVEGVAMPTMVWMAVWRWYWGGNVGGVCVEWHIHHETWSWDLDAWKSQKRKMTVLTMVVMAVWRWYGGGNVGGICVEWHIHHEIWVRIWMLENPKRGKWTSKFASYFSIKISSQNLSFKHNIICILFLYWIRII